MTPGILPRRTYALEPVQQQTPSNLWIQHQQCWIHPGLRVPERVTPIVVAGQAPWTQTIRP